MNDHPLESIRRGIIAKYPAAKFESYNFDQGGSMDHIHLAGRLFACAYFPSRGYGIDEALDDDGLTSTFRHGADDAEGALLVLLKLIET